MKTKILISVVCCILVYVNASFAGDWATGDGSCYKQHSKNISVGLSLLHLGFFAAFDYGVHDAISVGIASGYNGYGHNRYWRYHYVPIAVRGAFHPFNLSVLADKIKVRKKLDAYIGLAIGGRVGWATWDADGTTLAEPTGVGGFFLREYIGIRFFPVEKFYISAEEGSGLGIFNLGVGFAF